MQGCVHFAAVFVRLENLIYGRCCYMAIINVRTRGGGIRLRATFSCCIRKASIVAGADACRYAACVRSRGEDDKLGA